MVKDEVVWVDDGLGSWRRKMWSVADRRLVSVEECFLFRDEADYLALLPDDLPDIFTAKELAQAGDLPGRIAQKMVYCLRKMGSLHLAGKRQRCYLYSVNL